MLGLQLATLTVGSQQRPAALISERTGYDAWGRLRSTDEQEIYIPGTEPKLFLGKGFTGHEHLPWFELINMNARLYMQCRFSV